LTSVGDSALSTIMKDYSSMNTRVHSPNELSCISPNESLTPSDEAMIQQILTLIEK
jgi:hypothetical protein